MPDKTLQRQPTTDEWHMITFVEEYYHTEKELPTPKTISDKTGYGIKRIARCLSSEVCETILHNRGIPTDFSANARPRDYLTPEQLAAVNTYLNFADTRPLEVKLRELEIPISRFYGWMKNKHFKDFLRSQSEEGLEDALSFAHRELVGKAGRGDVHAIKFLYEVTGRHTGIHSNNQHNIRLFLLQTIEIIQKHVQDPVVLQKIAAEFEALLSPTTQQTPNPTTRVPPVGNSSAVSSPVGELVSPVGERKEPKTEIRLNI